MDYGQNKLLNTLKKTLATLCLVSVIFPSVNLSAQAVITTFPERSLRLSKGQVLNEKNLDSKTLQASLLSNIFRAKNSENKETNLKTPKTQKKQLSKPNKKIPTATNLSLVSILVEESLLKNKKLRSKIERYALDAQAAINGQSILITIPADADPFEIYEGNAALYLSGLQNDQKSQLVGTVLIGDIPLPQVKKNGRVHTTVFPYIDFENLNYVYDESKKIFTYEASGDEEPEIWHGIINPNSVSDQKISDLISYFDRNHQVHTGQTTFNKQIFYADLPTQRNGIPPTLQKSYQLWIDNVEDIYYNRFTKEMVAEFLTDMDYGSLVPDNYFPSGETDLVPAEYQSEINSSSDDIDTSGAPDIFAKNMVEAFVKRYFQLNESWLSRTNETIRRSGRWQPDDVDTTVSLVSKKDESAAQLLKKFNDEVETILWNEVDTQNAARDITIPKGGTLRQKTAIIGGNITYEYFAAHKDSCPLTHTCDFVHFPTYWNGEKIDDWEDSDADEDVQKCSLLRGNSAGKVVEFNRVFNLKNIDIPANEDDDIEDYCLDTDITKCCALIDTDNPEQVLREQCRFEDIASFNFSYGETDAYRFFEDEKEKVKIVDDIFDKEMLPLFDYAGTTSDFGSNTSIQNYIGAKGCEPIMLEGKTISGLNQISSGQKKSFSSLMNHVEPTPATILAQYQKLQDSPAMDLPVDNPRGFSFYDNSTTPVFQRLDYPNVFSLRDKFTTQDTNTREQNLLNEIDTILSTSINAVNNTGGNTGKINSNIFQSLWNQFDKYELVEAITWLDQTLEQKNISVMTSALKGTYKAQKELLDPNFNGYEIIYINGEAADFDDQTYQIAFEQGAQTPSDLFTNLKLRELNDKSRDRSLNLNNFYGTKASSLFSATDNGTTASTDPTDDDVSNSTECDRSLLKWSKTCLVPWVKSIPDWFGKKNKIVPPNHIQKSEKTNNNNNNNTSLQNANTPTIISATDNITEIKKINVSPSKIHIPVARLQPIKISVELLDDQDQLITGDYQTEVSLTSNSSELNQFFSLISPAVQTSKGGKNHFFLSPQAVRYGGQFSIDIKTNTGIQKSIPVSITANKIQALSNQNQVTVGQTEPVNITANIMNSRNEPALDFNGAELIFSTEDGKLNIVSETVVNGEAQSLFFPGIESGEAVIKIQDRYKTLPPEYVYIELLPDKPHETKIVTQPDFIVAGAAAQPLQIQLSDQYGNLIDHDSLKDFDIIELQKPNGTEKNKNGVFWIETPKEEKTSLSFTPNSPLIDLKSPSITIPVIDNAKLTAEVNHKFFRAGDQTQINVKIKTVRGTYPISIKKDNGATNDYLSGLPDSVTTVNGETSFSFTAPTKKGTYKIKLSADGFESTNIQFVVEPNIAYRTELTVPQYTLEADDSTPLQATIRILDAYDNELDQVSQNYYLMANPTDKINTNLSTELQNLGVVSSSTEKKSAYASNNITEINLAANPGDLVTLNPTLQSYGIWNRNFEAAQLNFTTGGKTTVDIKPVGKGGRLNLVAVASDQKIIPSTAEINITETLSRQDFDFLSPKSLLTILLGNTSGDLNKPNLANEFLFNGNTQAVVAATPNLGFSGTSVEDGLSESNVGWHTNWKPATLMAAGNAIGKSTKYGATDALVLYGDPTLSVPKDNPQTVLGLTENTGTILWKSPQGTIDQVITGDLNLDGRSEIFALTGKELQGFYHDKNQLDTYRHIGPILRFGEGVKSVAAYPDTDKTLAYIIQLTEDGALIFHENNQGVLTRTTKNLGLSNKILDLKVGQVNQDQYADLVVLDTNNTLWFVHGRAGREFYGAQKLYDFAPKFSDYTETHNPNRTTNKLFDTDSQYFLQEFFVTETSQSGVSNLGLPGARIKKITINSPLNEGESKGEQEFIAFDQNQKIKGELKLNGSSVNQKLTPGEKIKGSLKITKQQAAKNLQIYIPKLSGFKNADKSFQCPNCTSNIKVQNGKNGTIISDINFPTRGYITLNWEAEATEIPAISFLLQDFAGNDGIDDVAVPWTSDDGTKKFIKFTSTGSALQYPALNSKKQKISIPSLQEKQSGIKNKISQLSANLFNLNNVQAPSFEAEAEGALSKFFAPDRKQIFSTTIPAEQKQKSLITTIQKIFSHKSKTLKAQAFAPPIEPKKFAPPNNDFPPTHKREIDDAFPNSARSPLMNGTADYEQIAKDALTALSNDNDNDGLPDNYKMTPVEIALKSISCGGRCGLPIPSYAFMAPGQQSLYIPPFGFPSLPTLPIPGIGLPALQIIPMIPFVLPFVPSIPASLFRLFVAPTITGQVGLSICLGPPTGFSIPPLPVGNCFVVIPPLLELIGACPANILGDKNSPALMAIQAAFSSGNTGTILPKPQKEITNIRVVTADIITTWLQAQFNEFANFRLPKITFEFPRLPKKPEPKNSDQKNTAKELISSLEESDFFRVNREVVTIPYPSFSKEEFRKLKRKWVIWKDDFVVWKCESALGTWNKSSETCDRSKPSINANINQNDVKKVVEVQMKTQTIAVGEEVIAELEKELTTANGMTPEQTAALKKQIVTFKSELVGLKKSSSQNIDQLIVEDPRIKSSFEAYKTTEKQKIEQPSPPGNPNTPSGSTASPQNVNTKSPDFKLPGNFNNDMVQKMNLDEPFGEVETNVNTFEQNLDALESYAQFAEDIQKVPQQMKQVFYPPSVDTPNTKNNKKSPSLEGDSGGAAKRVLQKAESQIEQYINTYFQTWMAENKSAMQEWGQFKGKIFSVLKIWESIPQIFSGLSSTCSGCQINRGSMLEWALRVILGAIKLPVIGMPQLQDMTIDFSSLKLGLSVTIPDVKLEPTEFQVPDLPVLPRISEAMYAEGIEGIFTKLIVGLMNFDFNGAFKGTGQKIATNIVTQIKASGGSLEISSIDIGAITSATIPGSQTLPNGKTVPGSGTNPTLNNLSLGTIGEIKLVDLVSPIIQGKLEATLQSVSASADIAGIPGLPDLARNITGAVPNIPKLPSIPQLASFGLEVNPPVIELPMLPTLLRPPVLPNFLEPVQAILQIPKPIFKILCFISAGIIPIPEWKVASRIQEATNRSVLLPMDTFPAALTALVPDFPKINKPNFDPKTAKNFRTKISAGGVQVQIVNDFTSSFTELNEKIQALQNIAKCTTEQIGSVSRGKKTGSSCSFAELKISKNDNGFYVSKTLPARTLRLSKGENTESKISLAYEDFFDAATHQIDETFVATQTEKIKTILAQKIQSDALNQTSKSIAINELQNLAQKQNQPPYISELLALIPDNQKNRQGVDPNQLPKNVLASLQTIDLGKIPTRIPASFDVNAYQDKIFEQSLSTGEPTIHYYDPNTDTAESITVRDISRGTFTHTITDLDGDNQNEIVYALGAELYFKRRKTNINALKNDRKLVTNLIRWDYEALKQRFVPLANYRHETAADGSEINASPLHVFDQNNSVNYLEWTLTERPDRTFETNNLVKDQTAKTIDRLGFLFRPRSNKYSIRPVSATITKIIGSPALYGSRLKGVTEFSDQSECKDENILKPFYPDETLLIGLEDDTVFHVLTKNRKAQVPTSEWKKIHKGEETFVDFAEVCVIRGQLAEVEIHEREFFSAKTNDYLLDQMELVLGENDQVQVELFDGRTVIVNANEIYQMNIIEDLNDPSEPINIQKFKSLEQKNNYGYIQAFTTESQSARVTKLLHDPQISDDKSPPDILFMNGQTIRTLPFKPLIIDASETRDVSPIVTTKWTTTHPELQKYIDRNSKISLALQIPPHFVTQDFTVTFTVTDAAGNISTDDVQIYLEPIKININEISDSNGALKASITPNLKGEVPVSLSRIRNKVRETSAILKPETKNLSLKISEDEGSVAIINKQSGKLLAEVLATGRPIIYDNTLSMSIEPSNTKNPLRAIIQDQTQSDIFQVEFSLNTLPLEQGELPKAEGIDNIQTTDLNLNDNIVWQPMSAAQSQIYQNMQALIDTEKNITLGLIDQNGQFYAPSEQKFSLQLKTALTDNDPLEFEIRYNGNLVGSFRGDYEEKVWVE